MLAFLRMELRAGNVAVGDESRDGAAVVCFGNDISEVCRDEMIGMHEVGVQAVRTRRQAGEEGMIAQGRQRVPTHVGNFECRIIRLDGADFAGNPIQAVADAVLQTARCQHLHADADAEKRTAFGSDGVLQGVAHAGNRFEAAAAIGESPNAGQHDAISLAHDVWIGGHLNAAFGGAVARGAFERLCGRVQVAGAVVDDGDVLHAWSVLSSSVLRWSLLRFRRGRGSSGVWQTRRAGARGATFGLQWWRVGCLPSSR